MTDGTNLLFALPGFRVLTVSLEPDGGRRVLVETLAQEGFCPSCGALSRSVKDRPTRQVKDLPHGSVPLRVWVRKGRYRCLQDECSRRSFTEVSGQPPARARLTGRLRDRVRLAVTKSNRAVSDVADDYDLAWHTVHRALVAAAADLTAQAEPTAVLGVDETRARSVRWLLAEAGWRRLNRG